MQRQKALKIIFSSTHSYKQNTLETLQLTMEQEKSLITQVQVNCKYKLLIY